MYFVYQIKFENKIIYIGSTNDIAARWRSHCSYPYSNIYWIIQDFGKDTFTIEIVKEFSIRSEAFLFEEQYTRKMKTPWLLNENYGNKHNYKRFHRRKEQKTNKIPWNKGLTNIRHYFSNEPELNLHVIDTFTNEIFLLKDICINYCIHFNEMMQLIKSKTIWKSIHGLNHQFEFINFEISLYKIFAVYQNKKIIYIGYYSSKELLETKLFYEYISRKESKLYGMKNLSIKQIDTANDKIIAKEKMLFWIDFFTRKAFNEYLSCNLINRESVSLYKKLIKKYRPTYHVHIIVDLTESTIIYMDISKDIAKRFLQLVRIDKFYELFPLIEKHEITAISIYETNNLTDAKNELKELRPLIKEKFYIYKLNNSINYISSFKDKWYKQQFDNIDDIKILGITNELPQLTLTMKGKKIYIYKITHNNNIIYIGQTHNLESRFSSHVNLRNRPIRNYLEDNNISSKDLKMTIIDIAYSITEAFQKEIFWTKFELQRGKQLLNKHAGNYNLNNI